MTRREGLRRVEREIAAEKAAALGRAGERLEEALAATRALAARRRALDARLALLVQREALGLRQHRCVDERYPEPPRLGRDILVSRRTGR